MWLHVETEHLEGATPTAAAAAVASGGDGVTDGAAASATGAAATANDAARSSETAAAEAPPSASTSNTSGPSVLVEERVEELVTVAEIASVWCVCYKRCCYVFVADATAAFRLRFY